MLEKHIWCVYWGKYHKELGICMSWMKVQVIRAVMLENCSEVTLSSCRVCKEKQDADHMVSWVQGGVDGGHAVVCRQLHHLSHHFQRRNPSGLHAFPCPQTTGAYMMTVNTTVECSHRRHSKSGSCQQCQCTVQTFFVACSATRFKYVISTQYWLCIAMLRLEMLLLVVT